MKRMRKIMIVLALLLVVAGVTAYSATADAAKKSKKKVSYTLKNGTLTISGKGKMPASMTFENNRKIKTVVIKKGVTSIADDAFMNCKKLKKVAIPSSVKTIGCYSFSGTGLKSLEIPSTVKTIGQNAFMNCTKLKQLTVPGKFTYAIDKRTEAEEAYTLTNYTELDTVTFNTALDLKSVGYFCTNNLVVKADDPVYKSINGVIYSKDGKSIIRMPMLRKELVIEEGCAEFLLDAVLYRAEDEKNHKYGEGCTDLKKITIASSVRKVSEGKSAYGTKQVDLVIKSKQLDGKSISLLVKCFEMDSKTIQKLLPEQITYKDNMCITNDSYLLAYDGKSSDVKVPDGVKVIGDSVFYDNRDLEKVILPESVTKIEDFAFAYCEKLSNINLPGKLTYIGDFAFSDDSKLKSIKLPDSLTYIGEKAFVFTSIREANLPAGLKYLGEGAFLYTYLEEINIPKGITKIGDATFDGTNLKKVVIPDSVTKIGYAAFAECYQLKTVTFGSGLKEIKDEAFYDTPALLDIKIPANVQKIGTCAFELEDELSKGLQRKVTIMGSSKNISSYAFDSYSGDVVLSYKKGPKEYMTELQEWNTKKKAGKYNITFKWNKVTGASGYQIEIYSKKDFKKKNLLKKVSINKNKISLKTTLSTKRKTLSARIRPYKVVKGKKVYGRWSRGWKNRWISYDDYE